MSTFTIGCNVKLIGPIPDDELWRVGAYEGSIGMVVQKDGDSSVIVDFGPSMDSVNAASCHIDWLERGRVEWIKDEVTER